MSIVGGDTSKSMFTAPAFAYVMSADSKSISEVVD